MPLRSAGPTVLMADDHLTVAHGIRLLLEDHVRSFETVDSGMALLAALILSTPDVVLLDVRMPGLSGIETLEAIRLFGFRVPVVMLTMHDDGATARRALLAGATGYVTKQASCEELLTAMQRAIRGEIYVSPLVAPRVHTLSEHAEFTPTQAQLAVLKLSANGLRAQQIADELGTSRRTVESHKYMLMQALGVTTTLALIRRAKERGLI